MKTMNGSKLNVAAASALAIAGLLAAGTAQAGLLNISVDRQLDGSDRTGAAYQAQSAFLASLDSLVTEDFEGFAKADVGVENGAISTAVGMFGRGPDAINGQGDCIGDCADPVIMDTATAATFDPGFTGRYNTTLDGDQWLDSNDVSQIRWDLTGFGITGANAFGFFLMDPSDIGATMEVTFGNDQEEVLTLLPKKEVGELWYVSVTSEAAITGASVYFTNTGNKTANDGFGLDDVTVGVPEPGMLAMLGAGLLALGAMARRRRDDVVA